MTFEVSSFGLFLTENLDTAVFACFLDDLTHCALSEVTGKVVLGTRHGDVLVI